MRWRVLLWAALAIGATAAVVLGVDIVVAGRGAASGLAGIIAAFCELVAVVLLVTSWVGERRSAATRRAIRDGSVPEPGASAPVDEPVIGGATSPGGAKYVVDARGATGVQIGDGGVMHVDARRTPPQRRQAGHRDR